MQVLNQVRDFLMKVFVPAFKAFVKAVFGPSPKPPETVVVGGDDDPPPPPPSPYRDPANPEKKDEVEERIYVTCETRGDDKHPKETVEAIKVRTQRRAIRYFRGKGKEVRHRVTDRKPDSIEFGFFRRSGKPLHIRWHKEKGPDAHPEIQDPK